MRTRQCPVVLLGRRHHRGRQFTGRRSLFVKSFAFHLRGSGDRPPRNRVSNGPLVAFVVVTLVALFPSQAYAAKPTVTPNPVHPEGFITIIPDAACITAMANLPKDVCWRQRSVVMAWQRSASTIRHREDADSWCRAGWRPRRSRWRVGGALAGVNAGDAQCRLIRVPINL